MLSHLEPLVATSVTRTYAQGATIMYQGDAPQSACIIVKGVVRVYGISPQGDEQIVMYHIAGEFFPSSWIFGKSTTTLFFYEAATECIIAFTPRSELISFMLAQPQRMHALLDYFTTNYAASLIRVNALQQPRARDKLLRILYFLYLRYGTTNNQSRIYIPLTLTHQNLASLVGLTRETTTTELNKLKRQKVIAYSRQKYTVNLPRLLALIDEDSLSDVHIPS